MLPMKQILVPTDFSDCSFNALEAAQDFAKYFDAELAVLHVIHPPSPMVYQAPSIDPVTFDREMQEESWRKLDSFCSEKIDPDVKVHKLIAEGDPPREIAEAARKNDVDLIVIGTHGESGWRHMLFGSVAEKVMRMADRPVLAVQPDHEHI